VFASVFTILGLLTQSKPKVGQYGWGGGGGLFYTASGGLTPVCWLAIFHSFQHRGQQPGNSTIAAKQGYKSPCAQIRPTISQHAYNRITRERGREREGGGQSACRGPPVFSSLPTDDISFSFRPGFMFSNDGNKPQTLICGAEGWMPSACIH
jgi:hypothetical protein